MLKKVEDAVLHRDLDSGPGSSLLDALRLRTRALHVEAERSGLIADILQGRGTRFSYALLLRNLHPVYATMERALERLKRAPVVGLIVYPELDRAAAIEADLAALSAGELPLLPAAVRYAEAIEAAGSGEGLPLIAHAYTRYLGDLSGGQIIRRLLVRSLALPADALTFYDFPAISDIAAFKGAYRDGIERAGDLIGDFAVVVEEGARAFELNIELSVALQRSAAEIETG